MKPLLGCAVALSILAGCAAGDSPPDGAVDASMDAALVDAGSDAGEDAGTIEMVGLCEACVVHEQCGSLARCIALTDGAFACAAICKPDIPSCPRGFEGVIRPASPDFPVCAPIIACQLLGDSCGEGQTCSIVRANGDTSCVPIGDGGLCNPCPCAEGYVCSFSSGTCQKLCDTNTNDCPGEGAICQGGSLPNDVGLCVLGDSECH